MKPQTKKAAYPSSNNYAPPFNRSWLLPCFITLLLLTTTIISRAENNPSFPLQLSANKRYLVDKQQRPFLIKEISCWGLIQALSEEDEAAFIDSVKNKGFNTLLVSIISFDTRFAGGPPNWQGIAPFTKQWDFSTYNKAYFKHVDRFLKMAENKGMLVILVACYLGYKDDAKQGWWNELLDANNSVAKSRQYGEFIGKRYKNARNIIWLAGGDNNGEGALYPHLDNIIQGIKTFDKGHLWTGHFDAAPGTGWPTASKLYGKYIDIDGLYDFTESTLGKDVVQYQSELAQYKKGKMIFQLDQSYEHDIPHGEDNENYQWIRRKNYDGLLSGCAGTSFSPGQVNNQCYVFTNWRPLMNTTGMQQVQACFNFFDRVEWYNLVPIEGDDIIIAGRGESGKIDYVCAARTANKKQLIAYMPAGKTITVNLAAVAGTQVVQRWYNVHEGTWAATQFIVSGLHDFKAPTNEDWLLVLEGASPK